MSQDPRLHSDSSSNSSGEFENFGAGENGPLGALPGSTYTPPAPTVRVLHNNYVDEKIATSSEDREIDFGFPDDDGQGSQEVDPNTSSDQLITDNASTTNMRATMGISNTNQVKLTSKTDIFLAAENVAVAGSTAISLAVAIKLLLPLIIEGVDVVEELVEKIATHIRTHFKGKATIKTRDLEPAIKEHLRTEGTKAIYTEKFQTGNLIADMADEPSGTFCLPKLSLMFGFGKIILNSSNANHAASKFVNTKLSETSNPTGLKAALASKLLDLGAETKLSMSDLHNQLKDATLKAGAAALKAVQVLSSAVATAEDTALSAAQSVVVQAADAGQSALSAAQGVVVQAADAGQSALSAATNGAQKAANTANIFATMSLDTMAALQALVTQHLELKATASVVVSPDLGSNDTLIIADGSSIAYHSDL